MNYTQNPFAGNADSHIYLPEDDIDMLFAHLQQIEPPPLLIARILAQTLQITPATPIYAKPLRQLEMDAWAISTRQKN